MKCPYCDKEMENGFIWGRKDTGLPWYPADQKMPIFINAKSIEEHGGMLLGERPRLENTKIELYICRECKKGVCAL